MTWLIGGAIGIVILWITTYINLRITERRDRRAWEREIRDRDRREKLWRSPG
jgi:hypothetical protein